MRGRSACCAPSQAGQLQQAPVHTRRTQPTSFMHSPMRTLQGGVLGRARGWGQQRGLHLLLPRVGQPRAACLACGGHTAMHCLCTEGCSSSRIAVRWIGLPHVWLHVCPTTNTTARTHAPWLRASWGQQPASPRRPWLRAPWACWAPRARASSSIAPCLAPRHRAPHQAARCAHMQATSHTRARCAKCGVVMRRLRAPPTPPPPSSSHDRIACITGIHAKFS